ncbi:hypothetical protein [Pedosphaera parvula]|uniref:Uncharacterized protein n=1 Tax=Pedosphaera parvula (strain Ellin514) TaxID=320771 RepID=B9XBP1_PEDPL|nr:hypothetical protein [Pedosphaera parvula]EEF62926.1 hypothetical protein Cflav_PD5561 [Pedosphaera parvula Ellin514]
MMIFKHSSGRNLLLQEFHVRNFMRYTLEGHAVYLSNKSLVENIRLDYKGDDVGIVLLNRPRMDGYVILCLADLECHDEKPEDADFYRLIVGWFDTTFPNNVHQQIASNVTFVDWEQHATPSCHPS